MKLFALPQSTCTMRILMLLNELNVKYELVPVDLSKGEHKTPEFLERQPFGKIPAMEDDGFRLFESRAIMRYIARKYGKDSNLYGTNINEQSTVDTWIESDCNNFNGPISGIVYETVFKKMYGKTTDETVLAEKLTQFDAVLDVYERILSTRPYLTGDHMTIADMSHVPYMYYMIEMAKLKEPFERHPHVYKWYQTLTSTPAWSKTVSK